MGALGFIYICCRGAVWHAAADLGGLGACARRVDKQKECGGRVWRERVHRVCALLNVLDNEARRLLIPRI